MTLQNLISNNHNEKYTAIINAAFKIFARDGLQKGKIADIAQAAGVGKGTVYEYFHSKDDIFRAILNQFFDLIQTGLEEVNRLTLPADKKIFMILGMNLDWFKTTTPAEMLIMTEIWAQGLRRYHAGQPDNNIITRYRTIQELGTTILEQGVAEGVFRPLDSETMALLLMATLDGLGLHYLINQNIDIDKLKQVTIRAFLEGILVRPETAAKKE